MSTTEPCDLESHLGYWLRLVSNHVSAEFARELGLQNVSVAEWVAMRRLYDRPGMKPSDLARAVSMTQGAISKIIDKLQRKGWITSEENAADRRGRFLSLTDAGCQAILKSAKVADENDERFFGPLSSSERETLRRLMERLTEIHHWDDVPTS